MNAEEILAQVGGEHAPPENWAVFPLQRKRVVLGLAGWAFGTIMGLGLFLAIAFARRSAAVAMLSRSLSFSAPDESSSSNLGSLCLGLSAGSNRSPS